MRASRLGKANGTHRIDAASAWNVTFFDFTPTSGAALLSGPNGTGIVTHEGRAKTFVVSITTTDSAAPGPGTSVYTVTCDQAPDSCPSPNS